MLCLCGVSKVIAYYIDDR